MNRIAAVLCVVLAAAPARAARADSGAASPPDACEGFLVTRIDIAGRRVTREFVIRREIRTRVGEPFRAEDARADVTRIENLGVFSSVVVETVPADSTVALTYRVREMPWIVPYPLLTHTDQDGWSGGAGVVSGNLAGRTIGLSGGFLVGGQDTYAFALGDPWITGNHISLGLGAADLRRDDVLVGFREHSREFAALVGTWLGDRGRAGAAVSYFQMNADVPGVTLSRDGRDQFLRVGAHVGYDSRDSWRNPTRGWNNDALAVWSDGRAFGEPGGWWLTEFDVRRYERVTPRHTWVAASLLSLQSGAVGADVPVYYQYRMGGANSIRGYDVDDLGRSLFGKNQCIVTTEYQVQIVPLREYVLSRWSISAGLELAAFFDWGIAWNTVQQLTWDRGRNGFGVGVRFLLPAVNEVRADLALGQNGEWFLQLGILDKFDAQRARLR